MKKVFTICCIFLISSGFSAFSQCMSGTYSIGPIAANYMNFNAAVADLITNGVCGPVTFLVKQETYNEQLTIPFIQGSSDVNRITFKNDPANLTKAILLFSPTFIDPYLVLLDSAAYISFDGLWLNYGDPGVSTPNVSAAVLLRHGASHNTITNCDLYASSISAPALVWGLEYNPTSSSFNDNEISKCNLLLGNISMFGDLLQYPSNENRILNNSSQEGSTITMAGMGTFIIKGNSLSNPQVSPAITSFGIEINGCNSGGIVEANNLFGGWIRGIEIRNCVSSPDTILVANNMISLGGHITGGGSGMKGIDVFGSDNISIYNNNISVNATILPNYDAAFYMQTSTNIRLRNNNFCNLDSGLTMYFTNSSASFTSDYNNFFTSGPTLIGAAFGTTYANLNTWQAVFGSRDIHSVSVDPMYTDSLNLHVAQPYLRNNAISLPQINFDFDQEPRNAKPDIGADEFAAVIDSVWPGDANNDGVADASDLIPIGIYYGNTGSTRAIVSNAWFGNYSLPWNNQIANFNDAKFADCNGDGIVNLDDTLALTINGGLSHPLRLSLIASNAKKHAYLHFQNDTINNGSFANINFDFDINVGTTDSIYSFQLASLLNPINVVLNTLYTDKAIPTWGSYASNYIAISTLNSNSNKYIIAATAIDHQNKVVNQNLLHFGFKILNQTGQGFWYKLPVEKFIVYDNKGATLDYSLISDSVFVTTVTGINENSLHASELYFRNNDKIILNEPIDQLSIFDLTGRLILEKNHLKVNDEIVLPSGNSNMIILQFEKSGKLFQDKIFVEGKN